MAQRYDAIASVDINAPVERVWGTLTNSNLIKQYLHGTNVVTDWKVGSDIKWQGVWNDKPYEDKGIILAFEPNKLLSATHWSPMTGTEDKPENYHTVTYSLTPTDTGTHLTLTQSNNPSEEVAKAMVENGWNPVLMTLKSLLES